MKNKMENEMDNLEDIVFENQDETVIEKEDDKEYTKIDNLEDDPEISNQQWACISFISPEGVHNCKVRGIKIRGVYSTKEQAEERAEKLRTIDKYFDIFVGEVGKWLPWDPELEKIPEHKYQDKRLNKLIANQQKNNIEDLNTLVGKKKKSIDNNAKAHKKRVADSIKSVNQEGQNTQRKNNYDPEIAKERIRENIAKRKKQEESKSQSEIKMREELVLKEDKRIKGVENEIMKENTKILELEKNMKEIKEYMMKYNKETNKNE